MLSGGYSQPVWAEHCLNNKLRWQMVLLIQCQLVIELIIISNSVYNFGALGKGTQNQNVLASN